MPNWGRVRVTAEEKIKAAAKGLTVTQLRELGRGRRLRLKMGAGLGRSRSAAAKKAWVTRRASGG